MTNTTASLALEETVALISFVPPDERKPPTMDYQLFRSLHEILDKIELWIERGECRVLLFRSDSPKTFLAGANMSVLQTLDSESIVEWVNQGHQLLNRIELLRVPTIARISGYALGGGLEFAMACDTIYAHDDAQVGQTEAKLGFVTGWGGSLRLLRRVGPSRAKELLTSGKIIDASEAYAIGIVDFVGSAAQVDEHITEFVENSAACSQFAIAEMKHIIYSLTSGRGNVIDLERESSVRVMREGDTYDRVRQFLEGRRK